MKRTGLTIIEVMIALVIIGVLLAILSPAVIQSMRQTSITGQATQAVQIMNYLSRRLAANHTAVTPSGMSQPLEWNYGQLKSKFGKDLQNDNTEGVDNPDNYKVKVEIIEVVTWLGIELNKYRITVCFQNPDEKCLQSLTLSPPDINPPTSTSYVGVF
jgi:prepilin-type N-terminal cleavage/methylation domain-containing protein